MIPPSWPFAVWGVDILGPFPRAVGGYWYLFVAIDKFTKWPEATPMISITQGAAVAFLKSIVCRFGVPSRIITDNGTQFTSPVEAGSSWMNRREYKQNPLWRVKRKGRKRFRPFRYGSAMKRKGVRF